MSTFNNVLINFFIKPGTIWIVPTTSGQENCPVPTNDNCDSTKICFKKRLPQKSLWCKKHNQARKQPRKKESTGCLCSLPRPPTAAPRAAIHTRAEQRIRRPKERELHQMLGSAFDRRAAIEQDRRPAAGRNDCRQRGPIHARQPPECRVRRNHRRAGMSCAEERVRATIADRLRRDTNGCPGFAPERGGRRLRHLDPLRSIERLDVQRRGAGCRRSSASTTPRARRAAARSAGAGPRQGLRR